MLGDEANIVFLNEEGNAQSATDQINLLHAVVGELKPSRVININSRTAWGMYRTYGKQLSRFTELDANLFCFDYDEKGRVFGYIKEYIPECLKYLTHIMCDNQQVISDIRDHYGFTDEDMSKFQTVYVPAPSATATIEIDQAGFADKPVLWSGRLANQKRPELLLEIAEARPDIKFIAYGPPGDSDISDRITRNEIPNIDYRGVYTDITELDLSEYLCYLNTSAWEGLPTMIIQVMSAGLPVVTPLVGGIGELVDDTSGWIVEDGDSANAYVSNLIELLAQPHQARQRATQGKALINQRHEWGAYKQRLKEIGLLKNKGLLSSMNVLSFTRGLFRRTG